MRTLSLVVPCFNEEAGLPALLGALGELRRLLGSAYSMECIFVDDGSTDRTAAMLEERCRTDPRARVIHHVGNQGLGAALRTGFGAARGELIATMDSDCTYDPRELAPMAKRLEQGADVVVASPYHPDGAVEGVPAHRLVLSRILSRLYRWVTGSRLFTYTSLFRMYRAEVVREVQFRSAGFLSTAEILVSALRLGYRVVEHPTTLRVRRHGQSKAAIFRLIRDHAGCLAGLTAKRAVAWTRRRGGRAKLGAHEGEATCSHR